MGAVKVKTLVGCRIIEVRPMTAPELEREGWTSTPVVLVLDDLTTLYPAQDEEGNGPGVLLGCDGPTHDGFVVVAT